MVSRADGWGVFVSACSVNVAAGGTGPEGRVAASLRTTAIMFFTAVYVTALRAPVVSTRRWQAFSRMILLACFPMLSTLRHDWYAWAGIGFDAMSSVMTWPVEGVRKFVCEALIWEEFH